ncbi:MAG: Trm112 family protein [Deltaproteobacteria bacterium]
MDRTNIFRCPRCKGSLVATDAAFECHACRLSFAVIDGVPNFITAEATPLADDRPADPRR